MTFPQKILPKLISYLQLLERKGIRSLYLKERAPEARDGRDGHEAREKRGAGEDIMETPITSKRAQGGGSVQAGTSAHGGASAQTNATAQSGGLALLAEEVARCSACPLHATRTKTVFGVGNPATKVLFIGEAPGRDEDLKGEPFVGRAGQLLNKIFQAIDLRR